MSLGGVAIVVTGGSRGIGWACVRDAVARGARVLFCSRHGRGSTGDLEPIITDERGGTALRLIADVAQEDQVADLFATAHRELGEVDGVVINAAISREDLLATTPTSLWDEVLETNLTGAFLVARQAVRGFIDRRHPGRIVSIGSLSQNGVAGNASYAVSKGGLLGLTRSLQRHYGPSGVEATMVVPGYVETDLSASMSATAKRALVEVCPMRRAGTPEEIARVVNFLLTDAASGLGGQIFFATGGLREVPL